MKIPDTITAKVREFDIRESLPFTLSFAKRNPDEIETIVADKINARVNEAIHEAVLDVRRETIEEERERERESVREWLKAEKATYSEDVAQRERAVYDHIIKCFGEFSKNI